MAEKDSTPTLGGFDLLSNMLTGSTPDSDGRATVDDSPIVDPEIIKASLKEADDKAEDDDKGDTDEKDDKTDTDEKDDKLEDTDEKDDKEDKDDKGDEDTSDTTSSDQVNLDEYEADITDFLNSKFSEELGWQLGEEDAPKSIGEFVDFMKGVVDEASKPTYANDEVKAFDEFVKQGGSLRDFYSSAVDGKIDTDSIDMENAFNQKLVLKEHYANLGYGESRIAKMLKSFEEAGILEEQAEDGLELLKNYNEETKQKLLESQKKDAEQAEIQQLNFTKAVEDNIKNLDSILGVKLSDKDKKELEHAILTVDAEGYTPYQRKYMSNIKNLLESAFVTMKGDDLGIKIKAQGKSDAVKNLHDKLKANKGNKAPQGGTSTSGGSSSGLSVLSSMLLGS